MVRLVALLEAAQDRDGVLDAGLAHEHLLEPALQGGVLLDVLAVLVQRRRADHAQLAAGQHGLEHVARVHRGVAAGARTHEGVDLVDERDDLAVSLLDLLEDCLEALLELAAVLRAGDHRGQVQADEPLVPQGLRHVTAHDALGEALDDRGLAHAGLADEDRVVLRPAAQHLDDAADLRVAADDRVELPLARRGGEVDAVLLQRLEGGLRVLAGHLLPAAHLVEHGQQRLTGGTGARERLAHLAGVRGRPQQQVLRGDELVPQRLHLLLRLVDELHRGPGQRGLGDGGSADGGQAGEDPVRLPRQIRRRGPRSFQQRHRDAVRLGEELGQQVRGLDMSVAARHRILRGGAQHFLTPGRELCVHRFLLPTEMTCMPDQHHQS